jgi:HSP20 family molecular chaperone IbpA
MTPMAENVVVKKASEQIESCRPGYGQFRSQSLFGPMIPFGDLFGVNSFSLRREFEKEMDRAFSTPLGEGFELQAWAPSVEVKEVNGDLMVTAELPGIRIEDVKVAVTDDNLTIEDERKHETKEEKEGVYRSERSYGRFYRSIVLPEGGPRPIRLRRK